MEISLEIPQKLKLEILFNSVSSFLGIFMKELLKTLQWYLHTHIYTNAYNNYTLEVAYISININGLKNEVYIHNGVLLRHKKG